MTLNKLNSGQVQRTVSIALYLLEYGLHPDPSRGVPNRNQRVRLCEKQRYFDTHDIVTTNTTNVSPQMTYEGCHAMRRRSSGRADCNEPWS